MDVLFVNTVDFFYTNVVPPLGLYSLVGVLKRETDLEVEVINFDYLNNIGKFHYCDDTDKNIDSMAQYLSQYHATVVDFYTMCNSYAVTLCLAERLKALDDNVTIIMGGPQASLCAEDSLKFFPFIELIGIGEGELYISDLIRCLIKKENYTKIKGIAYRKDGKIVVTKHERMIAGEDLGKYTVYDCGMQGLDFSKIRYFPIEAGRGCPFACTFCSTSMFWGRKFRIKPIDQLIYEMKEMNYNFNVTAFSMEHDMFTVNKKYLIEFCNRMIEENLGYTWACSSRIDALDEECMEKMKEAGCKEIYMGIETGSPTLQKIINKNLKLEDAVEKILRLKKYNFNLTVSFIYGFPDETEADFRETIDMIQELLLNDIMNVQLHLFIPLPNTLETEKISNHVYFDSSQIELSVYNANKFSNKLHQLVRDYKDIFIQYYTFESEIRKKYVRIDFLISAFVCTKSTYKYSVNYILRKESLVDIYNQNVVLIEKFYNDSNKIPISSDFDGRLRYKLLHYFIEKVIDDEIKRTKCKSLKEIYKFEQLIAKYKFDIKQDTVILYSKYNVFKAFKTGELEKKETYAALSRTNEGIALKPINLTAEAKQVFQSAN